MTKKSDIAAAITAMDTAIAEIGCGTTAHMYQIEINRLARLEKTNTSTN